MKNECEIDILREAVGRYALLQIQNNDKEFFKEFLRVCGKDYKKDNKQHVIEILCDLIKDTYSLLGRKLTDKNYKLYKNYIEKALEEE